VRALIAASSALVRAGLEAVIRQSPVLVLAGTAHLDDLGERIRELEPDVVVVEGAGNEESLDLLLKLGPVFVLLAKDEDWPGMAQKLGSGIGAVLPPNASPQEITSAIEAAGNGLVVLHPDVLAALELAETRPRTREEGNSRLTAREIEVLVMLAEGLANKNIAWRLGISEHTVKFHISSIFTKLNASSRAEAVAIGMRQGILLL